MRMTHGGGVTMNTLQRELRWGLMERPAVVGN
jgi:hypothetical protein